MLKLLLFIFLHVLGFCTNSNRDTSYLPFEPLSVDESVKKSKKDNKPILLYFHANWCGICHKMNQVVWPDQDLQSMLKAFRVLDMYEGLNGVYEQRIKYRINAFPSIVFLSPNGTKITKFGGMLPAENLIKITSAILDKYPPKGPRPKIRTAKEKLPLDWSEESFEDIARRAEQQDRPFILFHAPKSNPLSSKLRTYMDNNINFRRMLKFFIMKDLSLDNVVRDKYVQKHSLGDKPALIFLGNEDAEFGLLHYNGDNAYYSNQLKLMMRTISQAFNDRLLLRINKRAKLEAEKQSQDPKFIPKYLIYEYRQFENVDAVLIFSENHGLSWLTEGDLLEGNRILDIRHHKKQLLMQVDKTNVAVTSGGLDKAVSVQAVIPMSSISLIRR